MRHDRCGEPSGGYDSTLRLLRKLRRCLGAYAESIDATTVIGLLAGTTGYAKVFREVPWPPTVENAWLVSPDLDGGGAQVKVAVDVHVRRATKNLGVVAAENTGGKRAIQAAWHAAVAAGNVQGPPGIAGTCAALDSRPLVLREAWVSAL